MRGPEQAFRAYYASMADTDLLQTAANQSSFIPIAQRILVDELGKRGLTPLPRPAQPVLHSALWVLRNHLAGFTRRLYHPHHPVSS